MDQPVFEASGHALQGPHKDPRLDLPLGFIPMRLVLVPGGLSVELTRADMLVGRHSEADIRLALPDVSRRHCRFVFQHGHWKIIDLNSLNGIYVNGERMQEAFLYDGDHIGLGGFTFLVQMETSSRTLPIRDALDQGILKSIADILPGPDLEKRKAS